MTFKFVVWSLWPWTHPFSPLPTSFYPIIPQSKQPCKHFFLSKRTSVCLSSVHMSGICSRVMKSGAWGARNCRGPGWSSAAGAGNDGGVTLAAVGNQWTVASYYHLKPCLYSPERGFSHSFLLALCYKNIKRILALFSLCSWSGYWGRIFQQEKRVSEVSGNY